MSTPSTDTLLLRCRGVWFISTSSSGHSPGGVCFHFYDFRRTLCCYVQTASAFISTTSGGRSAAAVRRNLVHFYDFSRTLCCCGCRPLVHFYDFRRTLCCCGAAASRSFLRLQADALLLRCGGVCFHLRTHADALLRRCGGVCFHIYVFKRTFCCCGSSGSGTFLHFQADALLLRCSGA